MVGKAAMQFLRLLDILYLIAIKVPGSAGVSITTVSVVETVQETEFVTLPCHYELEVKNSTYNMDWFKGNDKVLERHSTGLRNIFPSRVSLDKGCSIRLSRPQLEDSGLYTVRIFAPGEQHNFARGTVELVVLRRTRHTTTASATEDETKILPSEEVFRSYLDGHTFIPQFVLSLVGIFRIISLVGFHLFVTRNSPHSMTLGRRRYHYPAIGVILLMFIMSMIFSGIGFVTGDSSYYTVSSAMGILGCVGLFLHDSYLQRRVYRVTKPNVVGEAGNGLLKTPKTN